MIKTLNGKTPKVHPEAFVAETAVLIGDVTLEKGASVWYGAVLRADIAPIVVGENSNIQDGCMVHVSEGKPTILGKHVTVGHAAVLHACQIEDNALIGMGAVVLDDATVGQAAILGAGSVLPERKSVPAHTMALGSPAKPVKDLPPEREEDQRQWALRYVHLWQESYRE